MKTSLGAALRNCRTASLTVSYIHRETLFAEQFPHSFDCVALLARLGFAFFEQFVNSPQPRANHGTVKPRHSLVTRWNRMSEPKSFEVC